MTTTAYRQEVPQRRWWARPRTARCHHDRPAEILAVLQQARAIVEAGWLQNGWTAPQSVGPAGGGAVSACVVGAVAVAVRDRDPRADLAVDTAPALAFVWDAVFAGPGGNAVGRAEPRGVRLARMRDLARWNDQRGRTRDDVVAVLDRAAARVVATTVEPARV
jgi:hypothetical protein